MWGWPRRPRAAFAVLGRALRGSKKAARHHRHTQSKTRSRDPASAGHAAKGAKVTIIDAGDMARGIGTRLVAGGHEVKVLASTGEHAISLAEELGGPGASASGGVQHHVRQRRLVAGRVAGQDLDLLLAGDDENLKAIVARVVEPGGMRSIHTGPLRPAQHLEYLGFVHMAQQDNLGSGPGGTIKFISP
jgi:predicted dinucleotide-binding enzyme